MKMKPIPSIQELRAICQRTKDGHKGAFYSDWSERLPRICSIYITKILLHTSLTPNQITVFNTFLAVGAIGFLWKMQWWSYLVYVASLFLIAVLDCCDGEVARFKNLHTKSGLYLDISEATISRSLMFIALGSFFYFHYHNVLVLVLGLLASNSYLLLKVLHYTKFRVVAPENQLETMTGMPPESYSFLKLGRYLVEIVVLKPPATYIILLVNGFFLYLYQIDYIGWILFGFTILHTLVSVWLLYQVCRYHVLDKQLINN